MEYHHPNCERLIDVTLELVNLPEDSEALKAMVHSLVLERDRETQRAEEQQRRAEEIWRQAEELRVEMLRLQLELERFKKWYYGPRADRLKNPPATDIPYTGSSP